MDDSPKDPKTAELLKLQAPMLSLTWWQGVKPFGETPMKKLTVLCMLGLFVLISANTDSIAAPREDTVKKCNDGKDNDRDGFIDELDSDCDGVGEDPGGGGGGDTYSLDFSGSLSGDSNGDTYVRFSANGIGLNTVHDDLNTTIDLTHFAHLPVHPDGAGHTCFGGGVGFTEGHTFNPFAVSVRQGRRGRAEASVVFKALTEDGVDAVYSLHTSGYFKELPSGWPPNNSSNDAIVRMTSWEMVLNNHNPSDLMGACLSDGDWSPANEWQITVSLD